LGKRIFFLLFISICCQGVQMIAKQKHITEI